MKHRSRYENLSPTPQFGPGYTLWDVLKAQRSRPKHLRPPHPLPSVKTAQRAYRSETPSVIWFGHSSYLIHAGGFTILVDPVLSGAAAPVPFLVKAFAGSDAYGISDLPPIDCLVLSHNHYDHYDRKTVKALAPHIKRVVAPAGVAADLAGLPLAPGGVTELQWGGHAELAPGITLTATPARHFSGRGLRRNGTLWASYVLQLPGFRLFLGGDSGYDAHFRDIGRQYGPFDLAILECGQYDVMWPYIHSMPEELVTEAQELGAQLVLPVHWAKFALANHPWNEPIRRFAAAANRAGVAYTTPRIGEPVVLGQTPPRDAWWSDGAPAAP